jgi:hypothetical protein
MLLPKDNPAQIVLPVIIVVCVQVMPSVEYAADVGSPTATNLLFPKTTRAVPATFKFIVVQVIPSVEERLVVEVKSEATINLLFPNAIEAGAMATGTVLKVQVIPSVEEAAVVVAFPAIAIKILLPKYGNCQFTEAGIVIVVQVIPFVEYAAVVPTPDFMAIKILFPNAVVIQLATAGIVIVVQVIASVEYAAVVVDDPGMARKVDCNALDKIPILNVSADADVFVILIDLITVDVLDGTE